MLTKVLSDGEALASKTSIQMLPQEVETGGNPAKQVQYLLVGVMLLNYDRKLLSGVAPDTKSKSVGLEIGPETYVHQCDDEKILGVVTPVGQDKETLCKLFALAEDKDPNHLNHLLCDL